MVATAPHIDEDALRLAVVSLQHKRSHDPWIGPHGAARPKQVAPPGDWRTWLIMAGRGFGKTRTGAEWIRLRVQSGQARHVIIAGPTAADIRDIMIEGESGLEAVCQRAGFGMTYEPSKRRVTFANGVRATLVSADEPKRFRGLQSDTVWADEIASWRYPEAWDQMVFGNRLGTDPRRVATTTPRPIQLLKKLIANPRTVVTAGSTYENEANLAADFITEVRDAYEGTTLGRQELLGELIEDVEGALWKRANIDLHRVAHDAVPEMRTLAVAVDPATTFGENSDQTGIAAAGYGTDGEYYVFHGSGYRISPNAWGTQAVALYDELEADVIAAESNQGGEMVKQTILNACGGRTMLPKITLIHASRGKRVRAEPIAALYEQGRVHHVGMFREMEDQMCGFPVSDDNDDMVDALVHALTACGVKRKARVRSW